MASRVNDLQDGTSVVILFYCNSTTIQAEIKKFSGNLMANRASGKPMSYGEGSV